MCTHTTKCNWVSLSRIERCGHLFLDGCIRLKSSSSTIARASEMIFTSSSRRSSGLRGLRGYRDDKYIGLRPLFVKSGCSRELLGAFVLLSSILFRLFCRSSAGLIKLFLLPIWRASCAILWALRLGFYALRKPARTSRRPCFGIVSVERLPHFFGGALSRWAYSCACRILLTIVLLYFQSFARSPTPFMESIAPVLGA
jgi:hypothetical protein